MGSEWTPGVAGRGRSWVPSRGRPLAPDGEPARYGSVLALARLRAVRFDGPRVGGLGRGDTHRFESGMDGTSSDGTLTALHLGADARVGDWLAGVSVANTSAEADYRFDRSADACGGGGLGEGMVDVDLTSVHPYVGRRIGRGSVWATLGAGSGEVSVERCETGRRNETDLSMRLAALGGRHPFAGGERIEVSVVEEISVLDLTTGKPSVRSATAP